jgi:hypothetical protein
MIDEKRPPPKPETTDAAADPRPAYERPCLVKKRAVTRATLFSGGGGPSSAPPPLVATG